MCNGVQWKSLQLKVGVGSHWEESCSADTQILTRNWSGKRRMLIKVQTIDLDLIMAMKEGSCAHLYS